MLLVAVMIGCAAPQDAAHPGEPERAETRTPVSSPSAQPVSTPGPIEHRQAWPGVVPRVIPGAVGDSEILFLTAIAADGEHVLGQVWQRQIPPDRPGRIVLIETRTQRMTELRGMPTPAHQAPHADAAGRWFVWMEASRQPNLSDWTIFAFNLDERVVRRVAAAEQRPDGSYLPSSVWPTIDQDRVVWLQQRQDSVTAPAVGDVMIARLPDGRPEVLAERKRGGVISWPYVAWADVTDSGSETVRHDLRTGTRSAIPGAGQATYVAIHRDSTVWIRDHRELWLQEDLGAEPMLVTTRIGALEFLQFPRVTDRFITWQSNNYPAVYDRKLRRVVAVGEIGRIPAGLTLARGSSLVWTGPAGPVDPTALSPRDYFVITVPD